MSQFNSVFANNIDNATFDNIGSCLYSIKIHSELSVLTKVIRCLLTLYIGF